MRKFLVSLATAVAIAIPVQESIARAESAQDRLGRQRFYEKSDGVVGRYIVRLADSAAGRRGRFSRAGQTAEAVARSYGVTRILRVFSYALNGFSAEMNEATARRVSQDPRVEYVVQDSKGKATTTTQQNAPWGLDRIDQETGTDTTYSYDNDGDNVTVYVLDSGVRHTHNDFGGRAHPGAAFLTNYPGASPGDGANHGTLVASVIGGTTHGVAKAVDLVSVRVVDELSETFAQDIVEGIEWIVANHSSPAVINASLRVSGSECVDEAVENAISAGITFVAAAGNDSQSAGSFSPQRANGVIVVGGIDGNDNMYSLSNKGPILDLFAPAVGVPAASALSNTLTTTGTGTSMAAPHVAGIAARYLGLFPNASPADVLQAIVEGAAEVYINDGGNGSPGLVANSQFLDSNPPPPPPPSCSNLDCLLPNDALYPGWYLESTNMQYLLSYQGDGNLVLYDSSWNALWASDTANTDANIAVMQGDGNFVVYDTGWTPRYASNTDGNNNAWLLVQNDGNVVIYQAGNGPPIKSIRYD